MDTTVRALTPPGTFRRSGSAFGDSEFGTSGGVGDLRVDVGFGEPPGTQLLDQAAELLGAGGRLSARRCSGPSRRTSAYTHDLELGLT